jgi:hypothetical protein
MCGRGLIVSDSTEPRAAGWRFFLIKSRCFCNFLQEALPFFYCSKSMTSLTSRSLKRRCSRNSSMSR